MQLTILEPFVGENPIDFGIIKTDRLEAAHIHSTMGFEHQRLLDPGHQAALVDLMNNGEFLDGSQITMAVNGDGVLHLVDGQHRLAAFSSSDIESMEWAVRVIRDGRPDAAYAYLDATTKKRPGTVIGEALGFSDCPTQAVTAAGFALEYQIPKGYRLPGDTKAVPLRDKIKYVREHRGVFSRIRLLIDQAVQGGTMTKRQGRMLSAARSLPVIVETFETHGGVKYWDDFFAGSIPMAAEVYERLQGKPAKGPATWASRVLSCAWNDRDKDTFKVAVKGDLLVKETPLVIRK